MTKAVVLSAAFACSLFLSVPTFAGDSVPGHAVLAEPGGDAVVIWDASRVVASIVRSKMTDADADGLLKRDAVRVLARILPNIDRGAKTVTVRIIYAKSGAVSPIYGTPTFKGVEHYALLTVSGRDLASEKRSWMRVQDKDAIPSWFAYKVTGRLPPRLYGTKNPAP